MNHLQDCFLYWKYGFPLRKITFTRSLRNFMRISLVFVLLSFLFTKGDAQVTNETIPTGSYIINMGVEPQTIDNALKPYGLLYELLSENYVPVKWIIRPDKGKDEYDFIYQGTPYKGGPYIISADHRTPAINTVISNWEALGVIGTTTTEEITVPVYQTLDYFMNWTMDQANGSKVVPYFANAGIDPSNYNWVLPSELSCCNDIFVMPHADPVWSTHSRLFTWTSDIQTDPNGCDGSIWAACHAVSALENAFNPNDPTQQMNFLSQTTETATGTDDWADNSLQLWGDHNSGTNPPGYVYGEHGHPVMQFLGSLDDATENGSEQIYIPKSAGWRPESLVGVWDGDHPDLVTSANKHRAAKVVFGDAFGDPAKGKIMYEGGHSHAGSGPANIAAQRAFFNFSFWAVQGKAIRVTMNGVPNPALLDERNTLTLTADASGGTEVFSYQWISSCGGTFSNPNAATVTFTPPDVADPRTCAITCIVTDDCGTRTGFSSEGITIIPAPQPPVATDDNGLANPGMQKTFDIIGNDTDPNLDIDNASFTFLSSTTTANGGTFTYNGDGTIDYVSAPNFIGTDTISYQICDKTAVGETPPGPYCDIAVITIVVNEQDENGCFPSQTYQTLYSAYAQSIESEFDMGSTYPAIGIQNNDGAEFNDNGDWMILDLGEIVPKDETIYIYLSKDGTLGVADISGSDVNTGFTGSVSHSISSEDPMFEAYPYIVTQANGLRYIRIERNASSDNKIYTDGVKYDVKDCVSGCTLPEVSVSYTGNATAYDPASTAGNPDRAVGVPNNLGSQIDDGDFLSLNLIDNLPIGSRIFLYIAHDGTDTDVNVSGSDTNGSFTGSSPFSIKTESTDFAQFVYTVTQANGVQYLRFDGNTERIFVDAVAYDFNACEDGTPDAQNDGVTLCEDFVQTIYVLNNDSDPQNDSLTLSIIASPTNGNATIETDGTITYLPHEDYSGTDNLTYQICDPSGLCDQASVTISIAEDACTLGKRLAMETYHASEVTSENSIKNSSEALNIPDGGFAEFDNIGDELVLRLPNAIPVGVPLNVIIANDGDSTTCSLEGSTNGTAFFDLVTLAALTPKNDGTDIISYIPTTGDVEYLRFSFTGSDKLFLDGIEYSVCAGACEVTPNLPPLGNIDLDTTESIASVNINVLQNDVDQENGILTVTGIVDMPTVGSTTLELDGTITYTPQGAAGMRTFTYSVCDDGSPVECDTATVRVIVINSPPIAEDDVVFVAYESTTNIAVLADNGNGLDTDPEGEDLTISEIIIAPTNGTASISNNGTSENPTDDYIEYIPNTGYMGTDTLYYSICDPHNLCDTAQVAITIPNQAPTADTENVSTDECQAILVDVLTGDSDPENGILTVTAATVTLGDGSVVINYGQTITFTPDGGFTGAATVQYTICDTGTPQECANGTVNITVNPGISGGNNTPIAIDDSEDANIGQTVYIPVKDNDLDPEGTNLTVNITNAGLIGPSLGTISLLPNQLIKYTPTGGSGIESFQYWICENHPAAAPGCPTPPSLCDSATITILIENQSPLAISDVISTGMDQPTVVHVLENDVEPDDQTLMIIGVGTDVMPSNGATQNGGTVVINDNGTSGDQSDDFVDYTPATGFVGIDTFFYQICDDNSPAGCDISTVSVEVTAPMDLEISLTASSPTATLGTSIVFALTVTNTGGNDATGILVKDKLPDGYTYISDDSGGAYDYISGIWNVGTLASNGGFSTILITTHLDNSINTYNIAQVYRSNEFDIDSTPNNDDGDQSEDDEAFAVVIPDSDGDEIADHMDVDDDNDGILDINEDNKTGFNASLDSDGEGIPNYLDKNDVTTNFPTFVDLDHNGVNDNFDHDKDGIPDHLDLDTDNDGLPDFVEAGGNDMDNDGQADYVTPGDASTMTDADNDGLADAYDLNYNTEITNSDTDNDGLVDAYDLDSDNDGIADLVEVGGLDTDGNGMVDASTGDADLNGWADLIETTVLVNQSLADNEIDFERDNTPNHLDLDADNDGILDVIEAGGQDGNADGLADDGRIAGIITDLNNDGWEDHYDDGILSTSADGPDGNTIPDFVTGNGAPDFDGDGQANWLDIDADNDGIIDNAEGQATGAYIAPDIAGDTDGDGINDAYDTIIGFGGAGLSPSNTDQSDNPDYLDLDTDNDGETDLVEGHDADGNGSADMGSPANTGLANGVDADFDGLDDGFDNNIGLVEATDGGLTPDSFVNADGGTVERDWREVIDLDIDDDGIVNADEDGKTGFDPIADADNDGVLNYLDANDVTIGFPTFADANGDGVNDAYDSDLDGIPDYKDLDTDNDGIPDLVEAGAVDVDNNGIADVLTDTDGDGLVDTYDAGTTSNIANPDTDGDGIADVYDLDADNDGIADLVEVGGLDTDGDGKVDAMTDPAIGDADDNGWADIIETTVLVNQSLAGDLSIDFDGDTHPNHLDIDADNDGIVDVLEAGGADGNGDGLADDGTGTFVDANGDGWGDDYDSGLIITSVDGGDLNSLPDFATGSNNPDFDADGQANWLDIDADNDGIVDNTEAQSTTSYLAPTTDSDNDGLNDAYELAGTIGTFGGMGIIPVNTELVDNPDYLDLDTDNDGESDSVEGHDTNGDGIADGSSPSNTGLPGGYADVDRDGLLDGYDNNKTSTDPTNGSLTPGSHPNFDAGASEKDWRENAIPDIDKDNDGIVDVDEDGDTGFDPSGDEDMDGTPNYQDTNDPAFINTDANSDGVVDAFDTDSDGVADFLDLDSDNDGMADIIEAGGTDNNKDGIADALADSDGNGIPDSVDSTDPACSGGDTNSDGICDTAQGGIDTDGDGIQDANDPDIDGNGLADTYDVSAGGTAIPNLDTDGDGIKDIYDLDSDNDGIADLVEIGGLDVNGDGVVDEMSNPTSGDINNNGWADHDFADLNCTCDSTIDFDADSYPNHLDIDADNDGIVDVTEAGGQDGNKDGMADDGSIAGTRTDANGDGWADNYDSGVLTTSVDGGDLNSLPDFATGSNNPDFDADGQANWLDIDADDDGIVDNTEGQATIGYIIPTTDSDRDGLNDAYELVATIGVFGGAGLSPENTDMADHPDYLDPDTDNDGIGDTIEGHDTNGDGVVDGNDSPSANTGRSGGNTDADRDGLLDGFDNNISNTDPTNGNLNPESYPDAKGGTAERDWREENINTTEATNDYTNSPFNTPITSDVLTNDRDKEGDTQTIADLQVDSDGNGMTDVTKDIGVSTTVGGVDADGAANTNAGALTLNADGVYTFFPTVDFAGTIIFGYMVCDDGFPQKCEMATVEVEILPEANTSNTNVLASPDAYTTEANVMIGGNVGSNDIDPEGGSFSVTNATIDTTGDGMTNAVLTIGSPKTVAGVDKDGNAVSNAGIITIDINGIFTYVPASGFTGTITTEYEITDSDGDIDWTLLVIDVIPDVANEVFANDDSALTDAGTLVSANVTANDTDPESDGFIVTGLIIDSDGDGLTDSDQSANIDGTTAITLAGTDSDGSGVVNAGTLIIDIDGSYTFAPTAGFAGNINVCYSICDAQLPAACDPATLEITVLDVERDYGDAPEVYPNAWHRAMTDNNGDNVLDGTADVWLGTNTSFESSYPSSASAGGDSYDDAITFGTDPGNFPNSILPSTNYDVDIIVNSSNPTTVYYGLWIDWGEDGTYEDFYSGSKETASPAIATVLITSPVAYSGATANVRLRVDDSPLGSMDYQGGKTNGEVEDFQALVALPVELIAFDAVEEDCTVELSWETAAEEDFDYFEIQWSSNLVDFKRIGVLSSKGLAQGASYYFKDKTPIEANYYRLKMVDMDGSSEYSKVIYQDIDCKRRELNVYPNPVLKSTGVLKIELYSPVSTTQLVITDITGRIVRQLSLAVDPQVRNLVHLNISDLPSGTYILHQTGNKDNRLFIIEE